MVDTLQIYDKAINSVKKDLPNILRKILIDKRDQVIKILKEEQLAEGIDSSGKVVRKKNGKKGVYSKNTPDYIDPTNPPRQDKIPGQPYNFEWTGGLFDNMFLEFEDMKSFSLFSQDSKAKMLEKEYGDIFTLTKSNNERINQEILRPEMYEVITQRLYI